MALTRFYYFCNSTRQAMGRLINKFRPYARILLVIWLIVIVILATIPDLPIPRIGGRQIPIRLDYPVHFIEYFFLAFLAIISFVTHQSQRQSIKTILLILILFAIFAETLHFFIPFRSFELQDMGLNIAGTLSGTIVALLSIGERKG